MTKFILACLLTTVLLITTLSANAQQAGKIFRIGFLDNSTASGSAVLVEVFHHELNKLGWIDGKNVTIEYRFGESKGPAHMRELAADLVRLKVDLIVVTGTAATLAAKNTTTTIPIVMTSPADPVGQGLIVSLARPGGNVTGLSSLGTELHTKRLEILNDAVPKLARVGILRLPGARVQELQLKELRATAPALKLKLEEIETQNDPKGFESAFQAAKGKQVGAILTMANRAFFAARKRIVELVTKYRFPTVYPQKEYVDEGGLMFYGADYIDLYRRAAGYVDKILKGAKPADLPVQQATKFEFVINLKAAKQIGLTFSPDFLSRANRVIK